MLLIYFNEIANFINSSENNDNIILNEEVHSLNAVLAYLGKHSNEREENVEYFSEIFTLYQINLLIREIINRIKTKIYF